MVNSRELREGLRQPFPNKPQTKCRLVPAFTPQALQKNTCLLPPPKLNPYKENLPKGKSNFRRAYQRGELPISIDPNRTTCSWKVDLNKIDYTHYLPLFFEGLSETGDPYKFLAQQGIADMLSKGGQKLLPCIPHLIIPMKNALKTKNKKIMCCTLKTLQHLVKTYNVIGEALVPYYRQLLPVLNLFKERNVNCGDGIDYSQMKGENLADLINETLCILEEYGGEDAFINIKYLIPTYESCVLN